MRTGIRTRTDEDTERFARAFAHLLVDDPDVRPNLSIRLGDGRRELHLLYWGTCLAVRTGDPSRLLDAVALHAGTQAGPPTGAHRIDGCAIVGPGGAVVLPSTARGQAEALQRRLWEVDAALVDAPWVDVDASGEELLVPDPAAILVGGDPSDVLALPRGREEPRVSPGRYRLRAWLSPFHEEVASAEAYHLATAAAHRGTARGLLGLLARRRPTRWPADRASLLRSVVDLVGD